VLRHQLVTGGGPVYRVSGKAHTRRREVYDGVPGCTTRRASAIISKLHLDGDRGAGSASREKRELKAAIATMDLFREQNQRLIHSFGEQPARYWPEVTEILESVAPRCWPYCRIDGRGM